MKQWFSLKLRLNYREWSQAVDQGSLNKLHAWIHEVEQQLLKSMDGIWPRL